MNLQVGTPHIFESMLYTLKGWSFEDPARNRQMTLAPRQHRGLAQELRFENECCVEISTKNTFLRHILQMRIPIVSQ